MRPTGPPKHRPHSMASASNSELSLGIKLRVVYVRTDTLTTSKPVDSCTTICAPVNLRPKPGPILFTEPARRRWDLVGAVEVTVSAESFRPVKQSLRKALHFPFPWKSSGSS